MKKIYTDIKRVWKVTRKPTWDEYMNTLKVVFFGFVIIGTIGFLIDLLYIIIFSRWFG